MNFALKTKKTNTNQLKTNSRMKSNFFNKVTDLECEIISSIEKSVKTILAGKEQTHLVLVDGTIRIDADEYNERLIHLVMWSDNSYIMLYDSDLNNYYLSDESIQLNVLAELADLLGNGEYKIEPKQ